MIGRVGQWRSALSAASATRSLTGRGAAFAQRTKTASPAVGVAARRASSNNAKPLGLKEGVDALGMTPTTRVLAAYITVGMAAMFSIARFKNRDDDEEESARVYNMAKRAVVKDRRFFEQLGYPKEFELIASEKDEVEAETTDDHRFSGSFRVIGDKGRAVVTYKQQKAKPVEGEEENDQSDVVTFEQLNVQLEDGTEFSALASYAGDESVAAHQKSSSLGKKLFLPVIGGVLIGGVASFFVIRIVRNRPYYVHKLVLDHVNNSEMARTLLGHPIKSNRTAYVGTLTDATANYTIACSGPKGNGTLIVKAFKKDQDLDKVKDKIEIMTTPGTSWKFSTLMLSIKRNEKSKHAKTINLLAGSNGQEINQS